MITMPSRSRAAKRMSAQQKLLDPVAVTVAAGAAFAVIAGVGIGAAWTAEQARAWLYKWSDTEPMLREYRDHLINSLPWGAPPEQVDAVVAERDRIDEMLERGRAATDEARATLAAAGWPETV